MQNLIKGLQKPSLTQNAVKGYFKGANLRRKEA